MATAVFYTKGSFEALSTNQKLPSGQVEMEKMPVGSGNLELDGEPGASPCVALCIAAPAGSFKLFCWDQGEA